MSHFRMGMVPTLPEHFQPAHHLCCDGADGGSVVDAPLFEEADGCYCTWCLFFLKQVLELFLCILLCYMYFF